MSIKNIISAGGSANDRLFADDTTVAPAIAGEPTLAEISTFAGSATNLLVYYTGTDVASDTPTYVYAIDNSGNVTLIETPPSPSDALIEAVNQTAHGFTVLDAVYHDGTDWKMAQADAPATTSQAVVTAVADVDNFTVTTHGVATVTGHGLTPGEYYWLSQTVAGGVDSVTPTEGLAQSLLYVRDANTLFVDIEQPIDVTSSSDTSETLARIQLGLTGVINDATATHYGFDDVIFADPAAVLTNNAGAVSGLKAGKTYRLTANVQLLTPSAGNADFRFVDLTNDVPVGKPFEITTPTYGSNASSMLGIALFTPTTDCEVGVDFVTGGVGEISYRSTFTVEQVPTASVIPAAAVEIVTTTAVTGDLFEWDGTKLIPATPVSLDDATADLNQLTGAVWTISAGTNPATGAINLNDCRYYQIGRMRFYDATFTMDNDSGFTFEVVGATDVAMVTANSQVTNDGGAAQAAPSVLVKRTAANVITVDRDNDSDDDSRVQLSFMAIM